MSTWFSPWASSATEVATETKFGTKVEYTYSAEKVHDTTLDDEKYDVRYSQRSPVGKNMTDGT